MTCDDFVKKYNLKDKATSNREKQQVLDDIGLDNVGIYLQDGPFSTNVGILILHPSKGTHWIAYVNEFFFMFMVVVVPRNYLSLLRNGMVIVFSLNIKFKKMTVFVQVIVYTL